MMSSSKRDFSIRSKALPDSNPWVVMALTLRAPRSSVRTGFDPAPPRSPTDWRKSIYYHYYEGEGRVEFFEGNYQEYEADHKKRLKDAGEDPDRPHRMKYKKLA